MGQNKTAAFHLDFLGVGQNKITSFGPFGGGEKQDFLRFGGGGGHLFDVYLSTNVAPRIKLHS